MKIVMLSFFVVMSYTVHLSAQSPANLHQDINASHGFSSITSIENTYNNARRQEEIQLNLPTNSIDNLDLPASWDSMNENAKMLYLINDERTSRAGINYGQGPVLGLPFAGVAQGVDDVSQAYAQTIFNNDVFTHSFGGTSPSSRLSAEYGSCKEFTSRSENLYAAAGSSNTGFPRVVEKAIYGFNYDDAGSAWGHREMSLLQNLNLQGQSWGFSNNEGSNASEGYIGVGIYRGTNYGIFSSSFTYAVVLVLNYIDPSPSCTYTIIEATSDTEPPIDPPTEDPCDQPLSFTGAITSPVVASNSSITLGANVSIDNPTTISSPEISLNPGFSISAGSCVQFVSEGCAYNGTLTCDNDEPTGGTIAGNGTCASPYLISCNQSHSSSNAGQGNSWNSYSSGLSNGWTGAETIYRYVAAPGSTNSISLTNLSADVDMFLTSSCNNTSVVGSSTQVGLTSESINFSTASGGTFFIIIDGWAGAISLFDLSINCTSSAKGIDPTKAALAPVIVKKEQFTSLMCTPYVDVIKN